MPGLMNIRVARDALVAIMCGSRATNCFISCTVFSPWRSSNCEEINFALRLSAGPTALKFLSLKVNRNVIKHYFYETNLLTYGKNNCSDPVQ
jgi:hypothetical protein